MVHRIRRVSAAFVFLGGAAFAASGAPAGTTSKPVYAPRNTQNIRAAGVKPVIRPADQLTWVDAPEGNGVKVAVLWGDPSKEAFGAIHKFPAGFKAPLHTHSSDLHCVVVSGTIIHGSADGKMTKLGPGSYALVPHTYVHTTACDPASECQMFVHANGKFDLKPAGAKSTGK